MPRLVRNLIRTLYHNRDYRFWAYQCGGWAGYSLATFFSITLMDGNVTAAHVGHILLQALLGVVTSWPLRPIYRATFQEAVGFRVMVSLLMILLFSAVWTALRIYTFTLMSGEPGLWQEFHYWYFGSLFVFLSWTVLYYGIHYYELLALEHQKLLEESALREQEKMQRLQAESLAREAQLKMLRYQLNPHFLFNTLNAINAHVRLGESTQAGEMIQFLSRFLRHSLEQDSIDDVPLAAELEALALYLGIEQARFGDRLRLTYDVQDEALAAHVPSLILQPIVENAMKYAVAPYEEGGAVEIRAAVEDGWLVLQVIDDGPGMADSDVEAGTGIGLRNTLERLQALYQGEFEFATEDNEPRGLVVSIRLPMRSEPTLLQAGGVS